MFKQISFCFFNFSKRQTETFFASTNVCGICEISLFSRHCSKIALRFRKNLRIQAINLTSFVKEGNNVLAFKSNSFVAIIFTIALFLISLPISPSLTLFSPEGQLILLSRNQPGPSHHLESSNWEGNHPRDGKSAGFILLGTYFQSLTSLKVLISLNRFCTNVPHCVSRFS